MYINSDLPVIHINSDLPVIHLTNIESITVNIHFT